MGRSFSGSSGKNSTPATTVNAFVQAQFERSSALNGVVQGEVVKTASLNAFTSLFSEFVLSGAANAEVFESSLRTGLVGYWKLDGSSVDALGANNGADTAITYSAVNGRINSGALFDGSSSFISLGASSSLNFTEMSFFAWVKATGIGSYDMIVTRGPSGGSNYEFRFEQSTGALVFLGTTGLNTGFSPVVGEWHLVGFTRTSGNAVLVYSDAVQVGSGTITPTSVPSATTFLGKRDDGHHFEGRIDDAAIWNRVLTPTEISELYSLGGGNQYPFTGDPTGSWRYTGAMVGARLTATLIPLTTGKILISGGTNNPPALATAELYDPVAGTWASTGSKPAIATGTNDVLLPSGKVLAAGGFDGTSYLSTCALYDPTPGTWASTGTMSTARYRGYVFLLSTGKVLALSGESPITAVTELYDPVAGTWTNTGSMTIARSYPASCKLSDGKILAAGGLDAGSTHLASSEVYDPVAGTWAATAGSMAVARRISRAVLLPSGKVLVAGGINAGNTMELSAELFDPSLGTWSSAGTLSVGHDQAALVLIPTGPNAGKVLLVGGRTIPSGGYTDVVEMYDPVANTWSVVNPLSQRRGIIDNATLVLSSGKVLIAGGWNGVSALNKCELFTPSEFAPSSLLAGLSAYWKLDGNSTDVLGGHNGTDVGITYSAANGKMVQGAGFVSGSAINFTGISLGTNFTTACWVNPAAIGSVKGLITSATQGTQVGVWGVYVLASGVVTFYDDAVHNSTGVLSAATWQHVVVTHDGTTIRFYLNGALDPSSYAVASTFTASKLGNDTFNQFLNGAMDEVGIWDRALSLAEIQQLYRLGIGLPYPF